MSTDEIPPEPIRASSVCTERTISHRADSCGRILVMDAGRIVESASTAQIFLRTATSL